jgi:hypothetical protein
MEQHIIPMNSIHIITINKHLIYIRMRTVQMTFHQIINHTGEWIQICKGKFFKINQNVTFELFFRKYSNPPPENQPSMAPPVFDTSNGDSTQVSIYLQNAGISGVNRPLIVLFEFSNLHCRLNPKQNYSKTMSRIER